MLISFLICQTKNSFGIKESFSMIVSLMLNWQPLLRQCKKKPLASEGLAVKTTWAT